MAEQLKNIFFQKEFTDLLATKIKKEYSKFDSNKFNKLVYSDGFEKKSLKEKMRHISLALGKTLPEDFETAVSILVKIEKHFNGFNHLMFADFVETFGLDHFKKSMEAIEIFTRSSAEFAIRPFIAKYPEATMKQMMLWAKSDKDYVRRLASEGCRPRLPWGMRLQNFVKDPTPIIPILEILKNDPSETVRRSVSNNLNDISKDHPEVVIDLAKNWLGQTTEVDKLIKHALRGLSKRGNKEALGLFGHAEKINVEIKNLKITPGKIKIGDKGELSFDLVLKEKDTKNIRIEYFINYVKANGKLSKKIFQLFKGKITPGTKTYIRKHDFKERTTRKHYSGEHELGIVVNGEEEKRIKFTLYI